MNNFQYSCTRLGCKLTNHSGKREGGENMCHFGQLNEKAKQLEAVVRKSKYAVGLYKGQDGKEH